MANQFILVHINHNRIFIIACTGTITGAVSTHLNKIIRILQIGNLFNRQISSPCGHTPDPHESHRQKQYRHFSYVLFFHWSLSFPILHQQHLPEKHRDARDILMTCSPAVLSQSQPVFPCPFYHEFPGLRRCCSLCQVIRQRSLQKTRRREWGSVIVTSFPHWRHRKVRQTSFKGISPECFQ